MQSFRSRRRFPWNTALLLSSAPVLALVMFLAWFRWELPPLHAYYLVTYWECSRDAQNPGSTTQIQWLYKAAPRRKSEPLVEQDVDSNGSGFVPIGLSSSARQGGWTQLVMMPTENWDSSELASFLRKFFYGNRTFREVFFDPLLFLCVIPFILFYGAFLMRREIVEEWRQLYAGPFGDDLIFDAPALWRRAEEHVNSWKGRLIAGAKAWRSSHRSEPHAQPFGAENTKPDHVGLALPSRGVKPVVPAASPANPRPHLIFPGMAAFRNDDEPHRSWDVSQWIE